MTVSRTWRILRTGVVLIALIVVGAVFFYSDTLEEFYFIQNKKSHDQQLAESAQRRLEEELLRRQKERPPSGPRRLEPQVEEIRCDRDEDCIVVGNSCNGCCEQTAIAERALETFLKRMKECHARWQGPVCKCISQKMVGRCRQQSCVAVQL